MATIGYYSMTMGQGDDQMRDDIIAAGHKPVAITEPSAAELADLDALYVWNGSNSGYAPEFVDNMPDISAAVDGGMNMVMFDRAIGVANPSEVLPGTMLKHVRATTRDADLTEAGEAALGQGAGGQITDESIDGGNYTTHGYVDAGSLPDGATVLMTLGGGDENNAVGFLYDYGAGSVQFYGIPMDYYNENSQAWENFAINTLEFAAMCLARGTRVLTSKGYARVETLSVGQLIWTKDHGMQPLLCVVRSVAGLEPLVVFPKGLMGNTRELVLSKQHRVFVDGPQLELMTGLEGAFAVTTHLLGLGGLRAEVMPDMQLYNLLFERHEVILAEGAAVESLYVSPVTRAAMGRKGRLASKHRQAMTLAYPELPPAAARAVFAGVFGRQSGWHGLQVA